MTAEEWTLVKSVFSKAQEIDPASRSRWIGERTDLPASVVAEALRLIQAAELGSSFGSRSTQLQGGPAGEERSLAGEVLLERFEVIQRVGSGAMGDVFSAFDRQIRETIALKTLRSHLVKIEEFVLALGREVQLARRVRHPNVCQIFDLHQDLSRKDGPLIFFTMELLIGQSLATRIENGRLGDLSEALRIAEGIARGLEAIHETGLIHRDLKPANVFLLRTEEEWTRPVITDFGLCFDQERPVTETLASFGQNAVIGTPAYMAPEQLLGRGATRESDIHAFGVILFEMVTGRRPFEGDTPLAVSLRRLKDRAPSPREFCPELPLTWERCILACLKEDAAKRPRNANAVFEVLERETSLWERTASSRRKLLVAGVAAVAGAGALQYLPRRRRRLNSDAEYHLKLGLEYSHQTSPEGIRNAIDEIKQAVSIDPRFAEAWANLADVYCMASTYSAMKSKEARKLAIGAAQQAIALDSSIGLAHAAYAYALAGNLKQWRSAEPYFQNAIRLDPNNTSARSWYAGFLGRMSRFGEAVAMAESALRLEPGLFRLNQRLGAELTRARLFDRGLTHMLVVVRLHPAEPSGFCLLGRCYEWLKRYEEADKALRHADKLPGQEVTRVYWATLSAARGDLKTASRLAEDLRSDWMAERTETNVLLMAIGSIAMATGDEAQTDRIVNVLREGIRREDETVLAASSEPYLQVAKGDTRFVGMLKELQLE